MNIDLLNKRYQEDLNIVSFSKILKQSKSEKYFLEGLKASALSLVGHAIYQNIKRSQFYVLPDREQAEYFQNDLEAFFATKTIWMYPSPFKNDNILGEQDSESILQRTEVLTSLKDERKGTHIVVSYPEAFLEKVISKEELNSNTFEAETGSKLDLDFIIDFLSAFYFERTDFVYSPGTYAIRGGIVDIYSFANELPYRIELNDDIVESIRLFDPQTQLSVKKFQKITIIPNMESDEVSFSRISIFDYLPADVDFYVKDFDFFIEKIALLESNFIDEINNKTDSEKSIYLEKSNFESNETIIKGFNKFNLIELGGKSYFKTTPNIEFVLQVQPEFNRNFKLLNDNILSNTNKGVDTIIFSDQAKQVERIYAIFEDLGTKAEFFPIYKVLHEGFVDLKKGIAFYTEHQIFGRYQRYKSKKQPKSATLSLKELYDLKPGDYVTHIDYGVGIFSGLEKIVNDGNTQEAIRLKYKGNDLLYVNIHSLHKISRYIGQEGKVPKMNKLGTNTWENLKNKTKTQVKDIARDLIKLYAKRKASKGLAFSPDSYLQNELEASFIYEDTPDQAKATIDVKRDMESNHPMDRLICGDVGFGKTEIAIRAAFKAACDGKQVAILVPTTVLALQHSKTFRNRLAEFPVTIDFISRFKTPLQQKEVLKKVEEGKIDILIGTHRILSKDLKFKDLGLLIIDEEQKFGVGAKEKLRQLKANVDTLILTATPIPRTLQFSLMGARDMSVINTPPPNRQPVSTKIEVFDAEVIKTAIENEVLRGGQVFYVHNRIKDLFQVGDMVQAMVPDAKVAVAHAQMEAQKLEELMTSFIDGYYDVFVSTNIVEAGLDIPNANTIIIDQAQNFGLSDLYQLRGRVGRSNKKAYCYLLTPPKSVLTSDARKRLAALEEHTDLGSGFQIAMKDLDIRGAGNLLGGEQSGFIAEIGLEMYQKILQEAMQELKEAEFKDLFEGENDISIYKKETAMESDLEVNIPDRYVSSVNERISLYSAINDIKTPEDLQKFEDSLEDRFGPVPFPTKELLRSVKLRWYAEELFIEKLVLKRTKMRAIWSTKNADKIFKDSKFGHLIDYMQVNPSTCKMEQKDKEITITFLDIRNIKSAIGIFEKVLVKEG